MTIFSTNTGSFEHVTINSGVTASNALITGVATVRELRTLIVTSSVIYESGSTKFGDSLDDTHQFTGSLGITGELVINGTSYTAATSGTSGTSGSSGSAGSSGTAGSSGSSGTSGSSGSSGTSGSSGSAGTSGSSGSAGTSGSSGSAGTSGSSGSAGSSGSSGTSGSAGTSGTSGSAGTSGVNGSSGTSGVNGSSGTSGANGSSGSSGTSGANGSSGTSGANGSSGTSGVNGSSGTSGANGNSGSSGTSGANGSSGSSGTSASVTINSNTNNYVVTATGTTNTLQGEANLYFDGTNLGVGTTVSNVDSWARVLDVYGGTEHAKSIVTTNNIETGVWSHNSGYYGAPLGGIAGTRTNHPYSLITSASTRLTITSTGNVGIGLTNPGDRLVVRNAVGGDGIKIQHTNGTEIIDMGGETDGDAYIYFNDGSGTSKILLYSNGSSYFNGGNVGIGTTNPIYKLVVSNGGANGLEIDPANASGTQTAMLSYNRSTSAYTPLIIQASNVSIGSPSYPMFISGSGNVGIGTTTPRANLEVAGAGGKIMITNTGTTNYAELQYFEGNNLKADIWVNGSTETNYAGANSFNIYQHSNAPMAFYTNGNNERIRITGGGNVGIGTTVPVNKLHVYGTAAASSTSADNGVITMGMTNGVQLSIGAEPASPYGVYLQTKDANNAGPYGYPLLLNPKNGNVGIGITSPGSIFKLHVDGGAIFSISGDTTYSTYISPSNDNTINSWFGYDADGGDLWLNYRGYNNGFTRFRDVRIGNGKGSEIAFFKGSNGYVGIGTTSPNTLLHVAGTIHSYPTTNDGELQASRGATVGGATNVVLRANGVSYLNGGNVGIGTTNPTAKLYIEGGSANWSETTPGTTVGTIHLDPGSASDNFGNAITFGASDSDNGTLAQAGIYVRTDGSYGTKMYFATCDNYSLGSKVRMMIDYNGFVGLGTTSPSKKLVVVGSGTGEMWVGDAGFGSGNYTGIGLGAALATGTYNILSSPTDPALYLNRPSGYGMYFRMNNADHMIIDSGGLVGIGTSPATYRLRVQGDIYATADVIAYSDARVKENVVTIDNALNKVTNLRGVYYTRKDEEVKKQNIGVIAQEVLDVVPELVSYSEESDQYAVKYQNITALLIEAIKELTTTVNKLEHDNTELRSRITTLEGQ